MTGGYQNKILRVDLTNRTFEEETLPDELIHDYIGGRGFGVKLLYDDLKPGTDPLGEDNELIFTAGPLAGTNAQSVSRYKVFFKSPLTGGYFKSSSGGQFGAQLKFAGLDMIIVRGKSEKPVFLYVNEGKYELRDAEYLWGLDCDDTHALIREELGDQNTKIVCIGVAGEHGVKYAGIFSDRRASGRGGGGAVMGAKNLKAIAVRGKKSVEIGDKDAFTAAVKEQIAGYQGNPQFETFSTTGTWIAEALNAMGMYPTKNFREGVVPQWENLESSQYMKLLVRKTRCYSCMVHCGSLAKINKGRYAGCWTEGPEYETIWAFSGPMRNADIGLTIAADKLCDDLGLDTISTGSSIGFAYECYERGLITKEDTGGIELVYGNSDGVLEMIRKIAYREGIGDLLAEGTREAGLRIGKGAEEIGIQVKGLELPAYDPRGAKSHGLNLLTASIGADHNSGYAPQEVFGVPIPKEVDRLSPDEKGALTKWNQDSTAFLETGILCSFMPSMGMVPEDVYGRMLAGVTGIKDFADTDYLWKIGEKITNLERMFNVREGFGRKDDSFPRRIKEDPLPEGPSAGSVFEEEQMLDEYYTVRGWDVKTGVPTPEKLKELDLEYTIQ
ncbi:MAG: aldehyde ferredoxin oxidoreductase family protein [Dehalococcoidales bacterium]|nr:aldehyde ferredoxin oxidoreductase family protein [Dehalococcoidales bacterium]